MPRSYSHAIRSCSSYADHTPGLDAIVQFFHPQQQTVDVSCCCRLSRCRHDDLRFFERRHLGVVRRLVGRTGPATQSIRGRRHCLSNRTPLFVAIYIPQSVAVNAPHKYLLIFSNFTLQSTLGRS